MVALVRTTLFYQPIVRNLSCSSAVFHHVDWPSFLVLKQSRRLDAHALHASY